MSSKSSRSFPTPRREELGLLTLTNKAGLSVSASPNGALFSIDYSDPKGSVMINQVLGSPIYGGIGRLYLRIGGAKPLIRQVVGPKAAALFSKDAVGFSWVGEIGDIRHTVRLELHPTEASWFWRVSLENQGTAALPADLVLIQDVGLGDRGFLMNSEAYASQYVDHHIAEHPTFGTVIMNRQNLKQGGGRNPWLAHGCIDGSAAYATDAIQLVLPASGNDGEMVPAFGTNLPSERRQHEVACPAIQSKALKLAPGKAIATTFFALFVVDHPEASSDADLSRLDVISHFANKPIDVTGGTTAVRSLVQDAPLAEASSLDEAAVARLYPSRQLEERVDGRLLSFFVPDGLQNRHVVLRDKEVIVARRHGAILRSGQNMLLDDKTLAATCWMQGIFAAQVTIGNTSFHKLFSVSRDPYNLTRSSGLRILIETARGWQLLGVPSVFDMGLSDCRWIYRLADSTITVTAIASGDDPAMQWTVNVEGNPCRFLVFGHLVLGERDYEASSRIEFDAGGKNATFTPDPNWLWGQRYPNASYSLVTSTPDAVETIGGDELLYTDGVARNGPFVALRSYTTRTLTFAVTGSMTDAGEAKGLAERYATGVDSEDMLVPATRFWDHVTRGFQLSGTGQHVAAQAAMVPWLARDALVHLTVPHGLEQYTGAAWGTRDVCQGPIEFLLAYEHDAEVKDILRTVFSEQYRDRGDWPQWFMLEPYANIRAGESHGDIVVWPLKALCDYLEATDDLGFLDETVSWRADDTMARTDEAVTIADHIEKLLATVRSRFIPGTSLIRYGEGDWNDSLQPADPHLRDWMVSSWTVSLLYEQVVRYAALMERIGKIDQAKALAEMASAMKLDFNRHLIRDGIVAGYGLFDPSHDGVELLLHPEDQRTGLNYSLISMTQPMIGGLFTPEQRHSHMKLIEQHLLFPDGTRLMEKPATYAGGPETLFRRAESSSFFGREIGLMYVHAHLRYCEALGMDGDAEGVWSALALANPIAVTERLPHASLRQRNTYFSSSDAAFHDRYKAATDWDRVKSGTIEVDGGWRIYSSGPGLFTKGLICNVFGFKRQFGKRIRVPLLPESAKISEVKLELDQP
jgi:cellobiose phosphorylase